MPCSHAHSGPVAVAAHDEAGALQVDRVSVVVFRRPVDDHFDMRPDRQGTAAAEIHAAGTDVGGDAAAPAGRRALLGDPEMDREMNGETLVHPPVGGSVHLRGPPWPMRKMRIQGNRRSIPFAMVYSPMKRSIEHFLREASMK